MNLFEACRKPGRVRAQLLEAALHDLDRHRRHELLQTAAQAACAFPLPFPLPLTPPTLFFFFFFSSTNPLCRTRKQRKKRRGGRGRGGGRVMNWCTKSTAFLLPVNLVGNTIHRNLTTLKTERTPAATAISFGALSFADGGGALCRV